MLQLTHGRSPRSTRLSFRANELIPRHARARQPSEDHWDDGRVALVRRALWMLRLGAGWPRLGCGRPGSFHATATVNVAPSSVGLTCIRKTHLSRGGVDGRCAPLRHRGWLRRRPERLLANIRDDQIAWPATAGRDASRAYCVTALSCLQTHRRRPAASAWRRDLLSLFLWRRRQCQRGGSQLLPCTAASLPRLYARGRGLAQNAAGGG